MVKPALIKSTKELMVEPPATVESLFRVVLDVFYDFLFTALELSA